MPDPKAAPDAVQQIIDLWTRLHGEPPPIRTDLTLMVEVLVEALPTLDNRESEAPADAKARV